MKKGPPRQTRTKKVPKRLYRCSPLPICFIPSLMVRGRGGIHIMKKRGKREEVLQKTTKLKKDLEFAFRREHHGFILMPLWKKSYWDPSWRASTLRIWVAGRERILKEDPTSSFQSPLISPWSVNPFSHHALVDLILTILLYTVDHSLDGSIDFVLGFHRFLFFSVELRQRHPWSFVFLGLRFAFPQAGKFHLFSLRMDVFFRERDECLWLFNFPSNFSFIYFGLKVIKTHLWGLPCH